MTHARRHIGPMAVTAIAATLIGACTAAGAAAPSATAVASTIPVPTIARTQPAATPAPSLAPALSLIWEAVGDQTNQPGLGSTEIPEAYWPAIDPKSGNIWVAFSTGGRFWIFGPDGTPKGTFGEPGTGPGQFNLRRPGQDVGAGAIAFAPDGSFFVADDGNARVEAFDASHKFVKAWGSFGSADGHFVDPNQIATDGKNVYVSDDQRGDIQVFDTRGTFLRIFNGAGGWLTVDTAGHLFASGGTIREYDSSGAVMHDWPVPDYHADHISLAVDGKGRLYFNLQNHATGSSEGLVRFDPSTNEFTQWSTGGETLVIDSTSSYAYVANYVSDGWPKAALRKYVLPKP